MRQKTNKNKPSITYEDLTNKNKLTLDEIKMNTPTK